MKTVPSHKVEEEIEVLACRWAAKTRNYDLTNKLKSEALRLLERKNHPAPDAATAVAWATTRVEDAIGRYDHGTGAERGHW